MTAWHDEYVLWFVQNIYYAYSAVPLVVLGFVLLALPAHRRSAQILRQLAVLWLLCTIWLYGAFDEARAMTWVLLGCLVFRVLVGVMWRVLLPMPTPAVRRFTWPTGLLPGANWSIRLLREYLLIDPRAVYWFDLARAERGLTVKRTPEQRRQLLWASPEVALRRFEVWRFLLVRFIEKLIALYQRLPRYWQRRHVGLSLNDSLLECLLAEAAERARREFHLCLTDRDFETFLKRTEQERAASEEWCSVYGWLYCQYRMALVEFATFRKPWKEGEDGLLAAADWWYKIWLFRREFDYCWFPGELEISVAEPEDDDAAEASRRLDSLDEAETASSSAEDLADDRTYFDRCAHVQQAVLAASRIRRETLGEVVLPQQRERLDDLHHVSKLLAAYLGFKLRRNPLTDQGLLARLETGNSASVALLLLMVSCLRSDLAGQLDKETLRAQHNRVLERVRSHLKTPAHDVLGKTIQSRLLRMFIDYLVEQERHAELRGNFDQGFVRLEGDEHWKILGDARAALAKQMKPGTPMNEKLLYEAIEAYYRARWRGVWTLAVARNLVGVESTAELLEEFDKHPVEFSRAKLPPQQARLAPERPRKAVGGARQLRAELTVYPSGFPAKRRVQGLKRFPCVLGVAGMQCAFELDKERLVVKSLSEQHDIVYQDRTLRSLPLKLKDRFQIGTFIIEVKIL